MVKFKFYNKEQIAFAIADCHETLRVGNYSSDSPYGQHIWAQIDALRDREALRIKQAQ